MIRRILSIFRAKAIDWAEPDWANFLRAGGQITPKDWLRTTPESRGQAVRAARAILIQNVDALARTLSGPEGAADVASEVDGGRRARLLQLAQVGAEMLEDARGAKVRL